MNNMNSSDILEEGTPPLLKTLVLVDNMNSSKIQNDISPWSYYLFGISYLVCAVFGALVNAMAVYVVLKKHLIKTSTDTYIVCLSLSNFVMSTFATPLPAISSFAQRWLFGQHGCTYYAFVVCLGSYTNIALLAVISVDRYIAMVKTKQNRRRTIKNSWMLTAICFGHSSVFATLPIAGWSSYTLEGIQTHCSINWQSKAPLDLSFCVFLMVEMWCLPLTVIIFCYVKIYQRIKTKTKTAITSTCSEIAKKREVAISKTSLIIVVSFIFAWMPYAVVTCVVIVAQPDDIHPVFAAIPAVSIKLSMVYSPFVYMFRNKLFKTEFLDEFPLFKRFKCRSTRKKKIKCRRAEVEIQKDDAKYKILEIKREQRKCKDNKTLEQVKPLINQKKEFIVTCSITKIKVKKIDVQVRTKPNQIP